MGVEKVQRELSVSVQETHEESAPEALALAPLAPVGFARKLAGYLIAKRGFSPELPPEAASLVEVTDIVLSYSNGAVFELVCIIDGERYPGKILGLTVEQLREIAAANFKNSPSGSIFRAHNPVKITVIEVTEDIHSAARYNNLAPLVKNRFMEKRRVEICVVDPALGICYATESATLKFVRSVLALPPLSEGQIQAAIATRIALPSIRPYATYGLLALLAVYFIFEYVFNIGSFGPMGAPSLATLVSLGGIKQPQILQNHEWYRLWTAVILHINPEHILWNGLALFLAGRMLEPMIGRIHLLALFVIGGLCGSLASTFWNSPLLVGVGASGAISGCFAALLIFSFRFPPGALRARIWRSSIFILLPAVLPFLNFRKDLNIDYADHVGGIIGGLIWGGLLYVLWRTNRLHSGARYASVALLGVGVAGLVTGIVAAGVNRSEYLQLADLQSSLAKDFEVERLMKAAIKGADEFTYAYPKDPRGHIGRGIYFLDTGHPDSAEAEAKLALDQKVILDRILQPIVHQNAIAVLALAQGRQGRKDEARETATRICTTKNAFQPYLVKEGLCAADPASQ